MSFLFSGVEQYAPSVALDPAGYPWVVWVGYDGTDEDLFYSRWTGSQWTPESKISSDPSSLDKTPSLVIDPQGTAWVTWTRWREGQKDIYIAHWTGSRWTLPQKVNSPRVTSNLSPQIVLDHQDRPWIFWAGFDGTDDDIYYSYWNGQGWQPEARVNFNDTVPDVTPSATVDETGTIWVAWSGFDGETYRIYFSYWTLAGWAPEALVTSRRDDPSGPPSSSETSPSISAGFSKYPLLAWSSAEGPQRKISLSRWDGSLWSQPFELRTNNSTGPSPTESSYPSYAESPIVCSLSSRQAIVLWSATHVEADLRSTSTPSLHARFLELDSLRSPLFNDQPPATPNGGRQTTNNAPKAMSNGSFLDNEGYIAFGDSITAGDGDEENLGGYPPRLESLLDQQVAPSTVLNEGVPGETTSQGVGRIRQVLQQDQARYVLLMEGTNDIFLKVSTGTIIFNLSTMVDRSLSFGTIPLLATIIPLRNLPGDPPTDPGNVATQDLNEEIRQLAQDKGIVLVDQFQAFSDYPNYQTALYADRHHPNARGYDLMAQTWFNRVLEARVDGSVSVLLNRNSFFSLSVLETWVSLSVTAGALDFYLRLATPEGTLFYLTRPNRLGAPNTVLPLKTGLFLQEAVNLAVLYLFKGTEPPGTYTWTAILSLPGSDIGNPNNWVSSYSVSFAFAP